MKLSSGTKAIVGYEYDRAVKKHGPVFGSLSEGVNVMLAEMDEVLAAYRRNDIDGKHGVRRETAQVAAVCLKILEGLPETERTKRSDVFKHK